MILVLLGTHELGFTRLLDAVEKAKIDGYLREEIVVQAGNTNYKSEVMDIRDFIDFEAIDTLYTSASLIITHGGTGSIINGLTKNKKVIAMPRLSKFNEHNDDHQLEIVSAFEEMGYIKSCDNYNTLVQVIKDIDDFKPNAYLSKKEQMINLIDEFIEFS